MAEKHPPLSLDKAGLRDFIDHQLVPFKDSIDKIANVDTEEGVTMDSLTGEGKTSESDKQIFTFQRPLSIGHLATDSTYTGGDALIGKINDVAKSISDVYVKQLKLFGDLHTNLDRTLQKLMDNQHDTLVKIDGKAFLDGLGTVPGDFQGSGPAQS